MLRPQLRPWILILPCLAVVGGCQLFLQLLQTPPENPSGLTLETVVANANSPVDLAFAPDGRLFYVEKDGRVRIVENGVLLEQPFATVLVNTLSERGLVGLALHPDFATNQLVYIYYSASTTNAVTSGSNEILEHRVSRFSAATNIAGAEEILITLPGAGPGNHNGGSIAFGPLGKLFVSLGDLGVPAVSQDPDNLAGKILRYNDDGTIPTDNPFGTTSPVFATGLRNTFGIGFDAAGRLFGNENGPGNNDEVNLIERGANLGWPTVQGMADDAFGTAGEIAFAAATAAYRDPIVDKADGSVGAAGLAVNPGDAYGADHRGDILYGEFRARRIMRLVFSAGTASLVEPFFSGLPGAPRALAFNGNGILWFTTSDSIMRLVPPASP